ncbi:MAG: YdcF family protein [Pseudomonadota bacterium]|nr:YdcF family protein [Pseudomonadota bacterium]
MKKKLSLPLTITILVFMTLMVADLLLWQFLDYSRVSPPRLPANVHHRVDAIAVLAGGPGRIRQGYDLLRQDKARYLLIIGANPRSRSRDILITLALSPDNQKNLQPGRIIIENQSHNTLTNILALRDLCRQHHFHSLVIVTSTFHVKRAYHLCQKILPPQLEVYYQTIPPKSGTSNSADKPVPTPLLVKEFIKYLNALLQLAGHD